MKNLVPWRWALLAAMLTLVAALEAAESASPDSATVYNVRAFGAKGDGTTLDSDAINKAIETAASRGGGTVYLPAGTYLSFSIRLKSHISLYLDQGATLLAAKPGEQGGRYDSPEENEWDMYQDFGHSHWKNSLIWGIGLENVSILGPGLINGKGLTKRGPGPRRASRPGDMPLVFNTVTNTVEQTYNAATATNLAGGRPMLDPTMDGEGNKAIALKLCRNVVLRDFSVLTGGHFVLLATGVDNLTLDNIKIDTNRDGFDIDCCQNVRISNCSINSPNDDAIVLKSSFGLGYARATENVTIVNCQVSGYDLGTFLDGTFKRTQEFAPDHDRVTGRIKFGTESNGGFKNISIANCVFDHCRGIALETVDGGILEDVTINNITMRDVTTAPIFLRLGSRMRGPEGVAVGKLRRIQISNVAAYDVDPRYACIIAGIEGHPVEDVKLSNIRIHYRGGGTRAQAERTIPENSSSYPEPSMFGETPAYGFYLRHATGVELSNIDVRFMADDHRPAFVLDDVKDADLINIKAARLNKHPAFSLKNVENFSLRGSRDFQETRFKQVKSKSF
ncbi:MAG: glycoside hydrolase family 28 protein [Akkermansiaceae bacterium]|nr:glycoside hydrolase family 28 protein [Verrucomicrobiales bacterium]